MAAGARVSAPAAPPDAGPRAVWFGPPDTPLFGWWHPAAPAPAGHPSALAVLVCAAVGHEDLATHASLRRLALRLAAHGLPVLRYDHPGCGDAAELAEPAAWPTAAQQAVHQAADELRRLSGAGQIALVGLRLGALLAARAAAERQDVRALVAVLPVASGRSWLRECRLLDGRSIATAVVRADPAQGVDLGGLVLGPAPSQALSDLAWPAATALPPTLWIEREDLPPARQADSLREGGAAVERCRLPGLDRLTAVAHLSHAPLALDDNILGWLLRQATAVDGVPGVPLPAPPDVGSSAGIPSAEARVAGQVHERLVWVRERPGLCGVLSRCADTPAVARPRGLLLLSSGAERRVGPNRAWVPYARARAARGDVVLRLDLGGLGDSAPRTADATLDVYDPRCADDVAAAVAWLRETQGVDDCVVAGICSGGYHAWRAALGALPVSRVVPVNPLVFHWQPGMSLDPSAHAFGRAAVADDAMRSLRDPQRWLKLLRGQANLRVITTAVLGRLRDRVAHRRRALARWFGHPQPDDLAADLQRAVHHGVRPCFVFSEGDPGRLLLAGQGGAVFRELLRRGQVELHHLPGADHTLSHQAAREALWRTMDLLLDRQP